MLGLAAMLGSSAAFAEVVGDLDFIVGGRKMRDDTAWDGVDKPAAVGVQLRLGAANFPLMGELSLQSSYDDTKDSGVKIEATLLEYSAGAVLVPWYGHPVSPYFGAGITDVETEIKGKSGGISVSDDDDDVGYYVHAGINFLATSRLNLGLDLRIVRSTRVEMFGIKGDADYGQVGLVIGYRWGGTDAPSSALPPPPASARPAAPGQVFAPPPFANAPASSTRPNPPRALTAAPAPVAPALQPGAARTGRSTLLRLRPQTSAGVERSLAAGTALVLKLRQTNGDGAWWYAEAQGASGWVPEADLVR